MLLQLGLKLTAVDEGTKGCGCRFYGGRQQKLAAKGERKAQRQEATARGSLGRSGKEKAGSIIKP